MEQRPLGNQQMKWQQKDILVFNTGEDEGYFFVRFLSPEGQTSQSIVQALHQDLPDILNKLQHIKKGFSTIMNGLTLLGIALLVCLSGYFIYGRWLTKIWGIDPVAKTPAYRFEDGNDYVPSSKFTVFAHQFSSITGAGPVTGPIIAAMFGWVPVMLWLMVVEFSLGLFRISLLCTLQSKAKANLWAC
jgi:hypothetical protein